MASANDVATPARQSTSISRSGSLRSAFTLGQSVRWTDTPRPRVTNPITSSPGTGVQHFDSLTQTSLRPWTITAWVPAAAWPIFTGRTAGISSASSSASSETRRISRDTTDCGETWPSPIDT